MKPNNAFQLYRYQEWTKTKKGRDYRTKSEIKRDKLRKVRTSLVYKSKDSRTSVSKIFNK